MYLIYAKSFLIQRSSAARDESSPRAPELEHRDNVGTLQPRTRTTNLSVFLSSCSLLFVTLANSRLCSPFSINSTCCCGNYGVSNITRSCIDEIEMSAERLTRMPRAGMRQSHSGNIRIDIVQFWCIETRRVLKFWYTGLMSYCRIGYFIFMYVNGCWKLHGIIEKSAFTCYFVRANTTNIRKIFSRWIFCERNVTGKKYSIIELLDFRRNTT